jgi:MHS family citrate/tricarballylate:H+ symporter-like MFS transporter
LTEVVPANVRASCFALAYSLATALFGTSTPIVSKQLIHRFGDSAPALWLCAAALCSIVGALSLYRRGVAAQPATP